MSRREPAEDAPLTMVVRQRAAGEGESLRLSAHKFASLASCPSSLGRRPLRLLNERLLHRATSWGKERKLRHAIRMRKRTSGPLRLVHVRERCHSSDFARKATIKQVGICVAARRSWGGGGEHRKRVSRREMG